MGEHKRVLASAETCEMARQLVREFVRLTVAEPLIVALLERPSLPEIVALSDRPSRGERRRQMQAWRREAKLQGGGHG